MAWISSEYFYRRLMRSQIHITEQLDHQISATSEAMQKEFDAVVDERDELRKWKEAHLNERKDSATCGHAEAWEKSQEESRILQGDITASRAECSRVQSENVELRQSLEDMNVACREAESLQKSFDELQAAHEQLNQSNERLERHLSIITRDFGFQAQACRELERSRDDLQDEVDEGKIELQAHQRTISNLLDECSSKDNERQTISSQLELAQEKIRAQELNRENLESQLDEAWQHLASLRERAIDDERRFNKLQIDYETVGHELQELKDDVNMNIPSKDWDSFNDNCLWAMLVLLIALGIYGTWTGRLL